MDQALLNTFGHVIQDIYIYVIQMEIVYLFIFTVVMGFVETFNAIRLGWIGWIEIKKKSLENGKWMVTEKRTENIFKFELLCTMISLERRILWNLSKHLVNH